MDNNNEFPNGIIAKAPREGAPPFVKGSLSIKREEFMQWLSEQGEPWINLDIKVSKQGKYYTAVNTWKPKTVGAPSDNGFDNYPNANDMPAPPAPEDDLPF